MKKNKDILAIIIFLILVVLVWAGIAMLPQADIAALPETENGYSLMDYDLDNTIYTSAERWESWPAKLYAPDDFECGAVTDAPVLLTNADYKKIQYATHRLTLILPTEQLYAIYIRSSDFSMRLFIDGVEIGSVGTPGDTRETTEPRVLEKTYFFTPQNEKTEIIVQTANFVHGKAGCQPPELTIGTPENILTHTGKLSAFRFAEIGCLLTAALYHLGLFLLNHKRKGALYFSICCVLFAVMTKTAVLTFLTSYNFFFWIRVEYLTHFFVFMMLTLFIHTLFPDTYNKWILRGYYTLVGGYSLLTLLTDTMFFTGLLVYFEIASALIIVYTIVKLTISLRGGEMKHLLAFLGTLAVALPGLFDILYYRGIVLFDRFTGQYFITPIGMMFFVFCYALVLSIEYAETERAMLTAREAERRLAAENASLDRMSRLKTELMETISHEARTPLAVLSSYAGLVSMELKSKGTDIQMAGDLDKVVSEAKRVANLIDSMKKLTLRGGARQERVSLDISAVVDQTAELYRHILDRGGITLSLTKDEEITPVFGSPEELTQVLFNLLQNAKNHTEHGGIDITIKNSGNSVTVCVKDTGTGIAPGLLPHVFEKGVSGGSGSGIGLALCKDIIDAHGGTITIVSVENEGTEVTFALPEYKGGDKDGE